MGESWSIYFRGAAILGRLEPDVDEATSNLTEFRTPPPTSSTIKLQSRSRSYFPRNLSISIALKSQSLSYLPSLGNTKI
jgi:hypothetical protein